jgi:hypothetical protein
LAYIKLNGVSSETEVVSFLEYWNINDYTNLCNLCCLIQNLYLVKQIRLQEHLVHKIKLLVI